MLAVAEDSPRLTDLQPDLLARLVVMQVQSSGLFAEITKQPDLLVALEGVFNLKIRPGISDDFKEYGSRRESIQKLCQQYWQPETYLSQLFRQSTFAEIKREHLPIYLSMIGA